jgi:Zn-dependent protease with chaperone function
MATALSQISSVSWEHPADRAALRTLRALPGFDDVVRKIASVFGERGVRNLFLGDAVLVGPTQRPRLHGLYLEVLTALDWPPAGQPPPQLYVTQTPIANAGAVGFDQPFIVISSGTLELLEPDEQKFILAQQLGHIMTGRTTYRTIALIVLFFGMSALPLLASIALLPFQLALLEWFRKSELSADRAGMLGVQDPRASLATFLKLAGGRAEGDTIDLDAYLTQASEYEVGGTAWDSVLRALNTALREHPFHTVRAGELQRWQQSGAYTTIVDGNYIRRGSEAERPYREDVRDATDYYAEKARAAADTVGDVIHRAADAFRDAFRAASAMGSNEPPPPPPTPPAAPPTGPSAPTDV